RSSSAITPECSRSAAASPGSASARTCTSEPASSPRAEGLSARSAPPQRSSPRSVTSTRKENDEQKSDHALLREIGVRGRMKPLFLMILLGLVVAAGGGSFGRSTAEAAAPTLVTRSAAAAGSARAGARIAFSCGRKGPAEEVCVMNADGSGRRYLTR